MKEFLTISGAITIAIVGTAVMSFPFLAIFGIIGYFYIKETLEGENSEMD